MSGMRAYRRDSQGRFAGSGGGAMTTYGKAGGFANAAFRARASSTNQKASMNKTFALGQRTKGNLRFARNLAIGAAGGAAYGAFTARHPVLGVGGGVAAAIAVSRSNRKPATRARTRARSSSGTKVRR